MSRTVTQKDSHSTLTTTFINKFGVKPDRDAYRNYSKKHFFYFTDDKGKSYYIDERTNQKVTPAYERRVQKQLEDSYYAIKNIGKPIQRSQIAADWNVKNKAYDLEIKLDRAGLLPGPKTRFNKPLTRAQEGDAAPPGDEPRRVLNSEGELVIKGGKKQYLHNKRIDQSRNALLIAEEKANAININNHANALRIMGITGRTWKNPYYGDQRDYEPGGIYEGQTMPKNTPQVTPAKPPTTGEVLLNQTVLKEKQNKTEKAPASPTLQQSLTADLRVLNKLQRGREMSGRGPTGKITLAIMNKERELSNLKGETYPSFVGRDHHRVGQSTHRESREWLKINRI